MTEIRDYREILRREFEARCARNSSYSLRAFARDLGISVPSLSLILNRRQGLSGTQASRIAKRLGLNTEESAYFRDLVESTHARGKSQRQLAQARLRKYDFTGSNLQLDAFQAMSDWYHFAILELTEVESFRSCPRWIAKALGINVKAAKLAIERLKRLELLEDQNGRLRQRERFLATPSGVPSDALKKFHTQILKRAEEALYTQTVEERDFSTTVFPMDPKDLAWARAELKSFRRQLTERLEQAPKKKRVYCLSIQLFGLQQMNAEPKVPKSIPNKFSTQGETHESSKLV